MIIHTGDSVPVQKGIIPGAPHVVRMLQMMERDDDDKGLESKDNWRMERLWKVCLHTDWVSKVRSPACV
eukprot:6247723-Pyramimonas_sp.AAC.1